jgi:hypothetical protein
MNRFSLTCKLEHDMDELASITDIVEHVLCFGGDILNITGMCGWLPANGTKSTE